MGLTWTGTDVMDPRLREGRLLRGALCSTGLRPWLYYVALTGSTLDSGLRRNDTDRVDVMDEVDIGKSKIKR